MNKRCVILMGGGLTLFMWMAEGSEKPKREWSVKMVLIPITFACISVSCPRTLNAW